MEKRKGHSNSIGRGRGRYQRGHRGGYQGRGNGQRSQGESKLPKNDSESTPREEYTRGRGTQRGSSRGTNLGRIN